MARASWSVGAAGCAAMCALVVVAPAVAQAPAPLIAFYAPGASVPGVSDARDAVEQAAQDRGTAVVDLSPPAPAPPEAASSLRRAIESYHGFSYPQALAEIDAALAEASRTGARGLRPVELSDLYIYRALTLTAQGDTASAWDDFARAAAIDPTRTLDPARFPPGVVASFQRAAEAASTGPRSAVAVGVPASCEVWVDARPLEPAQRISLARGEHFVRIDCPQAAAYGARIVADRQTFDFAPALLPLAAPSDAQVVREAASRGATSVLYARVAPGTTGDPTLTLRVLGVPGGREQARRVVALRRGGGSRVRVAVGDVIDAVTAPPVVAAPAVAARPWYRSPWLWGAAGVVAASAVLLPLALDGGSAGTGFDVVLEGIP